MREIFVNICVMDIVEFLGVITAIIFGVISWVYSKKANNISEKSLESAKEANRLSEESLKVAKEANTLSERSLKISEKIENDNNESVDIEVSYVRVLDNDDTKVVCSKPCYADYLLIVPVRITNKSAQPVTIKELWTRWGKDGEYNCLDSDDFVDLNFYESEKFENVNTFPLYLKAKESKKVNIVITLFNQDDKLKFISKGMTFNLDATQSSYKFYVSK